MLFNLYNILSFYAWVLDLWIMYSCSWFFLLSFKNDIIMTYHLIYEISEWSPAEIIQNLSTEMKNRFCCNFYTINTSTVIFCKLFYNRIYLMNKLSKAMLTTWSAWQLTEFKILIPVLLYNPYLLWISSIFSSGKLCIFNSLLCVTGNQIHSALLNYLQKRDINLSKYFCYWMIDPSYLITKILDEGDNHWQLANV